MLKKHYFSSGTICGPPPSSGPFSYLGLIDQPLAADETPTKMLVIAVHMSAKAVHCAATIAASVAMDPPWVTTPFKATVPFAPTVPFVSTVFASATIEVPAAATATPAAARTLPMFAKLKSIGGMY
jgi:hypothetical protein